VRVKEKWYKIEERWPT